MIQQRTTARRLPYRKLAVCLFILALAAFGVWWNRSASQSARASNRVEADSLVTAPVRAATDQTNSDAQTGSLLAPQTESETSRLAPAGTYEPKDNVVEIEISEYAGYAGLIVANNGLEPTENSEFFRRGGFKVKLKRSEVESRSSLNAGKIAALATTVDVLPIYGSQFQVVVPAQIGYSRGADGVVVRREIQRINDLRGRVLATAQFTEADFFIRFLAEGAGLGVHMMPNLNSCPDSNSVNLVYCKDAFSAGDLFVKDFKEGAKVLAGCVSWAPKTTEIAEELSEHAHILATSRNLLIVADILIVNKGFAQKHPEFVTALVAGLLEGNRKVQNNRDSCLEVISKAFGWDQEETKAELAQVHLSNLPENQSFFSGWLDVGGCFGDIYRAAAKAYGRDLEQSVEDNQFLDLQPLAAAERSGAFKGQEVNIVPIRSHGATLPKAPLLSKDIRFQFDPNTFTLQLDDKANQESLAAIKRMLQVSPASTVLLRGHVDNGKLEEFRKKGGDKFVKLMTERALELSKNRALEIRRLLVERYDVDRARIDTVGLGWEEPAGIDKEVKRQVEAQWFTIK